VRRWDLITDDAVREHSLKLFPEAQSCCQRAGLQFALRSVRC
jgi:hypothetical protein